MMIEGPSKKPDTSMMPVHTGPAAFPCREGRDWKLEKVVLNRQQWHKPEPGGTIAKHRGVQSVAGLPSLAPFSSPLEATSRAANPFESDVTPPCGCGGSISKAPSSLRCNPSTNINSGNEANFLGIDRKHGGSNPTTRGTEDVSTMSAMAFPPLPFPYPSQSNLLSNLETAARDRKHLARSLVETARRPRSPHLSRFICISGLTALSTLGACVSCP